MEQEKYRTFEFTAVESGEKFAYKETHEGLMRQQEDGTWQRSWVFDSIDTVAFMVQEDRAEEWEVKWS